jgi:cytoskeletal protein CcmA (bactofilin family)
VGDIVVETPRGNIIANSGGIVQLPLNGNTSGGSVTLTAGSKDENGDVVYTGKIDASGSGVIGGNVKLEATGEIIGLVFARQNIDISSRENVNVTALAQGSVNVDAGGRISGTVIGIGSVSASGSAVDAALLSQNVSAQGSVSSSQVGFAASSVAGTTSQNAQQNDTVKDAADQGKKDGDESEDDKKKKRPLLARTTGRVTVILPNN